MNELSNTVALRTIENYPHLFKIVTPINVDWLESLLATHSNQELTLSMCHGLRFGCWPYANTDDPGRPATYDNPSRPLRVYEDFHQPILAIYWSIRRHTNISLITISGFGAAGDVWPYMTGDWVVESYSVQLMPFDGVPFARRAMIAKETHTSSSVMDLIIVSGVDDDNRAYP